MFTLSAFLPAAIHSSCVSVSVGGLILGLLLGALIYLLGVWLAGETGQWIFRAIGAILAVIVFIALGFSFSC